MVHRVDPPDLAHPDQWDADETLLADGDLRLLGRVANASNLAFLAQVDAGSRRVLAMYKPIGGERPLWDFPEGTLAEREVAAYRISRAGGWNLVPPTVLRDGPRGLGSLQRWIGDPYAQGGGLREIVDAFAPGGVPEGWLSVLSGEDEAGMPVVLAHEPATDVRAMAVFDVVVNNSDRKGAHCARDSRGRLWGFDQAITFSVEPKLRTVLWGWAGQHLPSTERDRLDALQQRLAPGTDLAELLDELLPLGEPDALRDRVTRLVATGRHPRPTPGWPSVPWPAL